jgi:hypothetical protein
MNYIILFTSLVSILTQITCGATFSVQANGKALSGNPKSGVTYPNSNWSMNLLVTGEELPSLSILTATVENHTWEHFQASGSLLLGDRQWLFHTVILSSLDYTLTDNIGGPYLLRAYGNDTTTGDPVVAALYIKTPQDTVLSHFPGLDPGWSFLGSSFAELNNGIDQNGDLSGLFSYTEASIVGYSAVAVPEPNSILLISCGILVGLRRSRRR